MVRWVEIPTSQNCINTPSQTLYIIRTHKKSFLKTGNSFFCFITELVKIMLGIIVVFSVILYILMPTQSTLILAILISNLVLMELKYYKNEP